MPEVRLSEKMKAGMKRLYEADGHADFVNVWTASFGDRGFKRPRFLW